MKIHYLGTCSGTEPMVGMHHTSLAIETGGVLYWFDAGESCAHTAYTSGMDLTKIRSIFISHPHIDHIGGLANLFACLRKLCGRYKMKLVKDNSVEIFFPGLFVFEGVKRVLLGIGSEDNLPFRIKENEVFDGLIYEDENIRVSALHNKHLGEDGKEGYHSYSYLIETEGKRIVFSGDVASPSELDGLLEDGCDCLIHETGHHRVSDVCEYAVSKKVGALRFTHHGREIIENRAAMEKVTSDYAKRSPISIKICYDKMTEEI